MIRSCGLAALVAALLTCAWCAPGSGARPAATAQTARAHHRQHRHRHHRHRAHHPAPAPTPAPTGPTSSTASFVGVIGPEQTKALTLGTLILDAYDFGSGCDELTISGANATPFYLSVDGGPSMGPFTTPQELSSGTSVTIAAETGDGASKMSGTIGGTTISGYDCATSGSVSGY